MEREKIFNQLDGIRDLPTLPVIAMEVNRMLQNESVSIDLLSSTIEKDQAIVLKMLKLVNSAFYGARSRVSSVSEAVIRLGFNSVRNIVVSVSVIDSLVNSGKKIPDFNLEDFWKHSIGVAMTSKYLSEKTGLQEPDDCFVGGLLHDIGLFIMAQVLPDDLSVLFQKMKQLKVSIYDIEKELMPVHHTEIGAYLARKWQLPDDLCDTVDHHHTPHKASVNPELTAIVYMGDLIISRHTVNSINPVKLMTEPALNFLDEESSTLLNKYFRYTDDWFPDHFETIREACEFFGSKPGEEGENHG